MQIQTLKWLNFLCLLFGEHAQRLLPDWELLCTKFVQVFYCSNMHLMRQRWTWGEWYTFSQIHVKSVLTWPCTWLDIQFRLKVISMTVWLLLTPELLFNFSCLYLWNRSISKTDMVHLIWEGVSTDCMRQDLEILSSFMYSTSGSSNHLLFMWPTYSWLWGWPTYKFKHWKWLVRFPFSVT